ncbi:MAG: PEP-CTERM system histidine kinase PrsK [Gammaproteobacteria bacterium]|nr:PEP-CTERM system histidine kinase PrsK [Gammaproteobacteria bacterium]
MTIILTVSFATAAAAFLLLSLLLAVNLRGRRALRWLLLASAGTALWAAASVALVLAQVPLGRWLWLADAIQAAIWLGLLVSLLPRGPGAWSLRGALVLAAIAIPTVMAVGTVTGLPMPVPTGPLVLLLAASLLALIAIEQIFRNADPQERRALNPLCLALGGMFAFNLFVYSHGLLLNQLDLGFWAARGLVAAATVPLLALAAKRHPQWAQELFVSRPMVFYSATLFGVGLYLMAMAAGGWVIRLLGGVWGPMLQVAFLAAAGLLLVAILFSTQFKARLRVFLNKHFFRSRYDYRREWLRLIATLSDSQGGTAAQRALKALCDILDSPTGELWVSRAAGVAFESTATVGVQASPALPADHPVTEFLAETQWVIDTEEYRADPERYSHAFRTLPEGELPTDSVIVPLLHEGRLLGLARLDRNAARGALNYEDHDLLKTIGRQVAVFLAQELDRDRLAETRQFEAFNRMTAFLMHDLKNLMAQQALIVQNAPRLRHREDFVDDAFRTIEKSVARMKKLLEQLQRGIGTAEATRINLTPILEEVVAESAARTPVPKLRIDGYCEVRGDRDKLAMAIAHAVRNAQDATPADGQVDMHMHLDGHEVVVEIRDTGCGMSREFIRDRLFRPFDTTKGASGMGIGAYQVREYMRAVGGRVEIDSAPGEGTCLRLVMPGGGAGSVDDNVGAGRSSVA